MKKMRIGTAAITLLGLGVVAATGCANRYDVQITVYNWEDYIFDGTNEKGKKTEDSTIELFQKEYKEATGLRIKVNYKTFSTCEDMYTKVSQHLVKADLCCPSDYMIQRMQREGLLESFGFNSEENKYTEGLDNVNEYTSPYIKDLFQSNNFSDFAVPYFWGTMGYTYNMGMGQEKIDLLKSWDAQWNTTFKKRISIKDSMRDTYFTAVMHVYKDELLGYKTQYENEEISAKEYNDKLSEVFNRCDDTTLAKTKQALIDLKKNVVLEVDEGKNDIALGNLDVNLAWSGDSVFSMDQADEGKKVRLGYAVPEEGSNVWFDGWCMLKGANVEASKAFLNFMARPDIAALNMDYTGYTSPIAGADIWDLVNEWYSADDGVEYDEVDLSYFFGDTIEGKALINVPKAERGRQFDAQYPTLDVITRCAIMRDFGVTATENLNNMWSDFRASL